MFGFVWAVDTGHLFFYLSVSLLLGLVVWGVNNYGDLKAVLK